MSSTPKSGRNSYRNSVEQNATPSLQSKSVDATPSPSQSGPVIITVGSVDALIGKFGGRKSRTSMGSVLYNMSRDNSYDTSNNVRNSVDNSVGNSHANSNSGSNIASVSNSGNENASSYQDDNSAQTQSDQPAKGSKVTVSAALASVVLAPTTSTANSDHENSNSAISGDVRNSSDTVATNGETCTALAGATSVQKGRPSSGSSRSRSRSRSGSRSSFRSRSGKAIATGDEVLCFKASSGQWEPATVVAVTTVGEVVRYRVRYEDVNQEETLPGDRVRRAEGRSSSSNSDRESDNDDELNGIWREIDPNKSKREMQLQTSTQPIMYDSVVTGDKVVAYEARQGKWYLATVIATPISDEDSYEVSFNHLGVVEKGIPRRQIRLLDGDIPTAEDGQPLLSVGTNVLFPKDKEWVTGFVCATNTENSTFDILDTLGEKTKGVAINSIRLMHEEDEDDFAIARADTEKSNNSDITNDETKSENSSCHSRTGLRRGNSAAINLVVSKKRSIDLDHLHVGSIIEANYQCKGKWLVGEITRECGDGDYDIKYENGLMEKEVSHFLIKPLKARFAKATSTTATISRAKSNLQTPFSFDGVYLPALSLRDSVVAYDTKQDRWYTGQIVEFIEGRSEALYGVKFDHRAAIERDLTRKHVRLLSGDYPFDDFDRPVLRIGMCVIFLRDGEWFTGFVTEVGDNQCYTIVDELGEKVDRVPLKNVRLIDEDMAGSVSVTSASTYDKPAMSKQVSKIARDVTQKKSEEISSLKVGTRIEGNFECQGKWLPGTIIGLGPENTYYIHYDNGYQEEEVSHFLVRPIKSKLSKATSTAFSEKVKVDEHVPLVFLPVLMKGSAVVAYERNQGKWYKGTVVQHYEGKDEAVYDVDFDHLDVVERDIHRHHIRLLDGDYPVDDFDRPVLQPGMGIIYLRDGEWVIGYLEQVYPDGTYDVIDELGEKSTGLTVEQIRLIDETTDSRSITDSDAPIRPSINRQASKVALEVSRRKYREIDGLTIGSRVEANYNCKGKWLTGVITGIGEEKTYNIQYDKGFEENDLSHFLVRPSTAKLSKATSLNVDEVISRKLSASRDIHVSEIPVGTEVIAYDRFSRTWNVGKVTDSYIKFNETCYDVAIEDTRDTLVRLHRPLVRILDGDYPQDPFEKSLLYSGCKIIFCDGERWRGGTVTIEIDNDTYNIIDNKGNCINDLDYTLIKVVDDQYVKSASMDEYSDSFPVLTGTTAPIPHVSVGANQLPPIVPAEDSEGSDTEESSTVTSTVRTLASRDLLSSILSDGLLIIKHGRKGSPKRRIFSCNSSVHSFYIQNPKSFATRPREKDANAKFFSLYDLSEIRRGTDPDPYNISTGARQFTGTPVLRRTAKPADLELCLSFVCATRTFDLQFLDEESYKIIYFNFKLILDSRRKMVTLSTRVHLSTQLDKKAITTEDVLLESFEGSDVASSDVAAEASDHVSYSLKSDKPDLGSDVENITLNEI